jgi:hypothetical protein
MQIKEGHQEMIRVALFVLILVLIVPDCEQCGTFR